MAGAVKLDTSLFVQNAYNHLVCSFATPICSCTLRLR